MFKGICFYQSIYSSSGKSVTATQTIDTFRTWAIGQEVQVSTKNIWLSIKLMQCFISNLL